MEGSGDFDSGWDRVGRTSISMDFVRVLELHEILHWSWRERGNERGLTDQSICGV